MYQRVSPNQARSDDYTFDVPLGHLSPNATGAGPQPEKSRDKTYIVPTSVPTDHLLQRPINDLKDGNNVLSTLHRTAFRQWFATLFDALMSLIPLFFLAIAVLSILLNGQPVSSYGEKIKAITLVSPTIFPIVYAAILGKALRRIGLFQAERSATVGTLEQLMGSQSVFTGIERQFGLRRVNLLGISIIIAWLLSPLGGQASLRLLSTKPLEIHVNNTVGYHAFETHDNYSGIGQQNLVFEEYYWTRYGPLFLTALQTSGYNLNGSRDIFGNVKIPDITSLGAGNNIANDSSDWYDTAEVSSLSYSSLLGNPIADIPRSGNTSFVVESSYWEIQCEPFSSNFTLERRNDSSHERPVIQGGSIGPSFYLNASQYTPGENKTSFTFDYQTKLSRYIATAAACTASIRIVESEINCEASVCVVARMRNSKRNVTALYDYEDATLPAPDFPYWTSFSQLCYFLPGADLGPSTKTEGIRSSELTEQWIADPDLKHFLKNWDVWGGVDLSTLPTEVFTSRLQLVFNTFWDSLLGVNYRVANSTSQDAGGANTTSQEDGYADEIRVPWNTTIATGMQYDGEQYVCNKTFAALTIVISSLLFMAASVSGVLGFITKAPDVLGYVSTLARDNPYFGKHVPSHLDGMEATRVLRDVRVMVGDVQKTEDVGHVAFASTDAGPRRVSLKRMYD